MNNTKLSKRGKTNTAALNTVLTGAVAVRGGLRDGAGQGTAARLGGESAELLLVLHKLDLLASKEKVISQSEYFVLPERFETEPFESSDYVSAVNNCPFVERTCESDSL